MKKPALLFLSGIILVNVYSQDKITTKNKTELDVKILEKTDRFVKYRMSDYLDGATISLKTSRIEKIEYENGYIDLLDNQNPRKKKPFSLNTGISYSVYEGEAGSFNLKLDYFIIPQIELEFSVIADSEDEELLLLFGPKFHLNTNWSTKRFTPFVGVLLEPTGQLIEIPIGINYAGKSWFTSSLSLTSRYFNWNGRYYYDIYAEFSIGWRFKLH